MSSITELVTSLHKEAGLHWNGRDVGIPVCSCSLLLDRIDLEEHRLREAESLTIAWLLDHLGPDSLHELGCETCDGLRESLITPPDEVVTAVAQEAGVDA